MREAAGSGADGAYARKRTKNEQMVELRRAAKYAEDLGIEFRLRLIDAP